METPSNDASRRTFPLSMLFLLIAASAVVSALLAPVARSIGMGQIGVPESIAASLSGGILLSWLGGVIGMYHYRQLRGLLWGVLTGFSLGTVLGPVSLAPTSAAGSIFSLTLGGSLILIGVGVFFRFARAESLS